MGLNRARLCSPSLLSETAAKIYLLVLGCGHGADTLAGERVMRGMQASPVLEISRRGSYRAVNILRHHRSTRPCATGQKRTGQGCNLAGRACYQKRAIRPEGPPVVNRAFFA